MIALPAWIDSEAWDGYVEMRRAMKKPMTARAEALVVKTLYTLKDKGHDPNAALDQSTVHNWIDVYEPKPKEIANLNRTYTNGQRDQMTEAERVRADEARRDVMAKRRPLRSVA